MLMKAFLSAAALTLVFTPAAQALSASQKVFKQVVTTNAQGVETVSRIEADKITPGDKVIYALSYENDAAESVENIVLTMPVPEVVAYIDDSAQSQMAGVSYSVDGGESFDARESLVVSEEDGALRPARAEDITHIRWQMTEAVAPGAVGELSFAGILK